MDKILASRRGLFPLLLGAVALGDTSNLQGQQSDDRQKIEWVADVLGQMKRIKTGMTRADLLRVFTTEGGLSTPLGCTFVSKQCPYFKVDVTFRAIGRPDKDEQGRTTMTEDERDEIVSISKPYLEYSITD